MISSFSLSDIDCRVYLDGKPETVFYWGTAKGHTDMEAVLKLLTYFRQETYIQPASRSAIYI